MKRFLIGLWTLVFLAGSSVPAGAESLDSRRAPKVFCGDFCEQANYPLQGHGGTWFIDGHDTVVFAESHEIEIVSTFSQKRVGRIFTRGDVWVNHVSFSNSRDFMLLSLSTGELYLFETDTWESVLFDELPGLPTLQSSAVSNDGRKIFVALKDYVDEELFVRAYVDGVPQPSYRFADWTGNVRSMTLDSAETSMYMVSSSPEIPWTRFNAASISSGPVGQSSVPSHVDALSLAIGTEGRVFAGDGSTENGPMWPATMKKVFTLLNTDLSTVDDASIASPWAVSGLVLSPAEDNLYGFLNFVPRNDQFSQPLAITRFDTDTLDETGSISLDKGIASWRTTMDVDPTGRYLMTHSNYRAYLITLDDSLPRLTASFGGAGSSQWVDWDYLYLNPAAKFARFEVRFTPVGKTKPKVKSVTKFTETQIGETAPGTQISVRAVYTKAVYNTAWIAAIEAD